MAGEGSWNPSADPDAPARGFNPPQTHRLWRDVLLPRTVIPVYWLYRLVLLPSRVGARTPRGVTLGIESGKVGWTHVFFEELRDSAKEYLGADRVVPIVVDRDEPYLRQAREWLRDPQLTHVVIDLRTGSQRWGEVLRDLLVVTWMLSRRGIVPIVILADASLRRHRLQAAVLTAFSGVVVTFMDSGVIRRMFPHPRVWGPVPIPISATRLQELQRVRLEPRDALTIRFIGRMYEPREQFLAMVSAELQERGIQLEVMADKYSTSNADYWRLLATSDVILTTTMQGMPRPDLDWIWVQQLVFRFTEALAAGAALVAPSPPGTEKSFVPGHDFASFVSVDDAVERISLLVRDPGERRRVAEAGHATAVGMVQSHAFWEGVDARLARPMRS